METPMPATGDAASVEDIFTLYRNGSLSLVRWGKFSIRVGIQQRVNLQ